MRKILLLLFHLFICQVLISQINISGVVKNYGKSFAIIWKQTHYELPFSTDTIFLENQRFNLEIESDQLTFINIDFFHSVGSKTIISIPLFANPRDTIQINLDFSKRSEDGERVLCSFAGTNAKGHELFFAYKYRPLIYPLAPFREILQKGGDITFVYQSFITEIEKLIEPYAVLLKQGQIDNTYFKAVTDEIKSGIFYLIISDLYQKKDNYEHLTPKEKAFLAGRLFHYFPANDSDALFTMLRAYYFTTYLRYCIALENNLTNFSGIQDTTMFIKGRAYNIINDFTPILYEKKEQLQEYLLAFQLLMSYKQFLIPDWVNDFNETFSFFKNKFPGSKYISGIETARLENAKTLVSAENMNPISPATSASKYFHAWNPLIVDDIGVMKNFDFKNEFVNFSKGTYYVDFWATWCQPCLAEMQYNDAVDSLFETRRIERIYVSIDKPEDHGKWLTTIYEYHLGGYHVLAHEGFKQWIFRELGNGETLMIPRYIFIKDGQVVNKIAAQPSEFQRLIQQVEQVSGK